MLSSELEKKNETQRIIAQRRMGIFHSRDPRAPSMVWNEQGHRNFIDTQSYKPTGPNAGH